MPWKGDNCKGAKIENLAIEYSILLRVFANWRL